MADTAFPRSEYLRRCCALQAGMAAQNVEALLLTAPADVAYVSGFLTRFWESPARPWFVIIPASGDPVAVIPAIGADLMGRGWITDIRTWDAPNPHDDGVTLLGDTLSELVSKNGKIGVPMGLETHLRMPLRDYETVCARLAGRRMTDATDIVQRVREIKSEPEIARIQNACAIAGRAFDRVPEFAGAGQGLDAVFRAFQVALLQEGADWVSYVAGAAGPDGYGDVISPADQRALCNGDVLMLDTGAVWQGYFCDFDRNFAIGSASDTAKFGHHALMSAIDAALDQLRPGHRACDLHRIMCSAIEQAGGQAGGGRLGHGLGLTLTEWPSLTSHDTTELREGMVLTLEPGVDLGQGRMMVHEENIVLRHNGPQLLSPRASTDLPEIHR
jgi:Xaa-Pro aminopeptidase